MTVGARQCVFPEGAFAPAPTAALAVGKEHPLSPQQLLGGEGMGEDGPCVLGTQIAARPPGWGEQVEGERAVRRRSANSGPYAGSGGEEERVGVKGQRATSHREGRLETYVPIV